MHVIAAVMVAAKCSNIFHFVHRELVTWGDVIHCVQIAKDFVDRVVVELDYN
jgi:hypothetical protein